MQNRKFSIVSLLIGTVTVAIFSAIGLLFSQPTALIIFLLATLLLIVLLLSKLTSTVRQQALSAKKLDNDLAAHVIEAQQRTVEQTERQMASILQTSGDAIYGGNLGGAITQWNPSSERVFGYTSSEAIGMPLSKLLPSDSAGEIDRIFESLKSGAPVTLETVRVRKDGTKFDASITVSPVIGRSGTATGFSAIARDISDKKRAEAAFLNLAVIVDSSTDAIMGDTMDGIITSWNKGAERIYGYTAEEMIGQPVFKLRPPEAPAEPAEVYRRLSKGEIIPQSEGIRMRKDGRRVNVLISLAPIFDASGKVVGISGIHHDITDRVRQQEQLTQLVALINSSSDAVFTTSMNGVIKSWNRGAEEMYGYKADEIIGKPISQLLAQGRQGHIGSILKQLAPGQRSPIMASHHARKDGRTFPISYTVSPIADGSGEVTSIGVVERDLSDIFSLQDQLRQAQKMEAIGRLAGGMTHDFNNFLTPILGFAELAADPEVPKEASAEFLQEVIKAAKSATSVTNQLLQFSRKANTDSETFLPKALIRDMEPLLRQTVSENIAVTFSLNSEGSIKADPNAIKQVILNLIVNARDAMPNGGTLKIDLLEEKFDPEYAMVHLGALPGDYVMISVTDSGAGMSEEVKAHLFEPFFTTKGKGKGTGLGLATSYGIIKQFGGHIVVYSEIGLGTSVKVYLPRVASIKPKAAVSEEKAKMSSFLSILLVEDEDMVRLACEKMLQRLGHTVTTSTDGIDALKVMEVGGIEIDLMLTDVMMPGMGGVELAKKVSEIDPKVKILFMTGYMDEAIGDASAKIKSIPILRKPFSLNELDKQVQKISQE